jgi:hypothetical protein
MINYITNVNMTIIKNRYEFQHIIFMMDIITCLQFEVLLYKKKISESKITSYLLSRK